MTLKNELNTVGFLVSYTVVVGWSFFWSCNILRGHEINIYASLEINQSFFLQDVTHALRHNRSTTERNMWSIGSVPAWRALVLSLRCDTWWRGCREHAASTSDRSSRYLQREKTPWFQSTVSTSGSSSCSFLLILHSTAHRLHAVVGFTAGFC